MTTAPIPESVLAFNQQVDQALREDVRLRIAEALFIHEAKKLTESYDDSDSSWCDASRDAWRIAGYFVDYMEHHQKKDRNTKRD